MKILALDTSTEIGSVAVLDHGTVKAEITGDVRTRHGDTLLGHIEQVLRESKLTVQDLELVAIGIGPGSFTGVRIGLATAKGLAFAAELPIVGICSARAVARGSGASGLVGVIGDAHKGEVYVSLHCVRDDAIEPRLDPVVVTPAEAAGMLRTLTPAGRGDRWFVVGAGLRRYCDQFASLDAVTLPIEGDHPKARDVAMLAQRRYRLEGADDLAALEPRYGRVT